MKHAGAKSAKITLSRQGDRLRTVTEDDGCGFDTRDSHTDGRRKGGFGLFSIRERLTSQGGLLTIESGPGLGTKITMLSPTTNESRKEGGNT